MQLRGGFFSFKKKQTCNELVLYMRVEVGLMHLANAKGTLNFSIRACLLACMGVAGG